jgi:hypothetical protein
MSGEQPRADGNFPPTHWSNAFSAGQTSPSEDALDALLRRYAPALTAHLKIKKRIPPDRAEALVQGFILNKILARGLLERPDPEWGKLRTHLLSALENYTRAVRRSENAAKHLPADQLAKDQCPDLAAAPERDVFDPAWALQVLVECLKRLRDECAGAGRPTIWAIFEGRVLATVNGGHPLAFDLLARRHSLRSPSQAANLLITAQRGFRRHLHAVIREFAGEAVDAEIADLKQILASAGAEVVEKLRTHIWATVPEVTLSTSDDRRMDLNPLMRLLNGVDWTQEPGALLHHLLTMQLPFDLNSVGQSASLPGAGTSWSSLGELFFHPNPPLELLKVAKRFAKENRRDKESPFPRPIATAVYYAAIAAALVRSKSPISKHPPDILSRGFHWAIDQPWMDERLRDLFRQAIAEANR